MIINFLFRNSFASKGIISNSTSSWHVTEANQMLSMKSEIYIVAYGGISDKPMYNTYFVQRVCSV